MHKDMAELWSAFSSVSVTREHAQFAREWAPEELLKEENKNFRINDPYYRWMVAQDAVELGAAVILTTAGTCSGTGHRRRQD